MKRWPIYFLLINATTLGSCSTPFDGVSSPPRLSEELNQWSWTTAVAGLRSGRSSTKPSSSRCPYPRPQSLHLCRQCAPKPQKEGFLSTFRFFLNLAVLASDCEFCELVLGYRWGRGSRVTSCLIAIKDFPYEVYMARTAQKVLLVDLKENYMFNCYHQNLMQRSTCLKMPEQFYLRIWGKMLA